MSKKTEVVPTKARFKLPSECAKNMAFIACCSFALGPRWQTQGPWAESGPPPCFIRPGTLFLPTGNAELSLNC